jgi:hypothetical protein
LPHSVNIRQWLFPNVGELAVLPAAIEFIDGDNDQRRRHGHVITVMPTIGVIPFGDDPAGSPVTA